MSVFNRLDQFAEIRESTNAVQKACKRHAIAGRRIVVPPLRQHKAPRTVPVSYVIVDPGYNLSAIETGSEAWQLVKQFHRTKLYARTVALDCLHMQIRQVPHG